ncbi:hypothetical protein KKF84_19065 [Myxococcota bacterium]|nr:hypothetical protein [Myxococcota bacterium]
MKIRIKSHPVRGLHRRTSLHTLLALVSLTVVVSSGCGQIAGAVAKTIVQGAARGIARGAARGIARGAARGIARGAARGIARGAVRGIARGTGRIIVRGVVTYAEKRMSCPSCEDPPAEDPPIQGEGKPVPRVPVQVTRVSLLGFSFYTPLEEGWRLVNQSETGISLFKTPLKTSYGNQSFSIRASIGSRGRYSLDPTALKKQRRENFEALEQRPRYSHLRLNSATRKLHRGADCVYTRAAMTDTGVPGHNGKKYTLYVDEVVCIHPLHKEMLVTLTYYERVPPHSKRERSPMRHMAKNLGFHYGGKR